MGQKKFKNVEKGTEFKDIFARIAEKVLAKNGTKNRLKNKFGTNF